ncbi:MAG: hypothetical protein ABL962_17440 [Fimbriimonadaceae bacterium]
MSRVVIDYAESEAEIALWLTGWLSSMGMAINDISSPLHLDGSSLKKIVRGAEYFLFIGSYEAASENPRWLSEIALALGASKHVTLLLPLAEKMRVDALGIEEVAVAFYQHDAREGVVRLYDEGNVLFDVSPGPYIQEPTKRSQRILQSEDRAYA